MESRQHKLVLMVLIGASSPRNRTAASDRSIFQVAPVSVLTVSRAKS